MKKFYVVYGTEENFYEEEIETFNTLSEANDFAEEVEEEIHDDGYDCFVRVAKGEEEKEMALIDIREFRDEQIKENFGEDALD